jgi:hypothetical protein
MGNYPFIPFKKTQYKDFYTSIDDEKVLDLRQNYTIIDVDYLHPVLVFYKMKLMDSDSRKDIVKHMLDFYMNHPDKAIYKKTEYLCCAKEKICICNTHADDLRKIYDGINYKPDAKYISWFSCDKK